MSLCSFAKEFIPEYGIPEISMNGILDMISFLDPEMDKLVELIGIVDVDNCDSRKCHLMAKYIATLNGLIIN